MSALTQRGSKQFRMQHTLLQRMPCLFQARCVAVKLRISWMRCNTRTESAAQSASPPLNSLTAFCWDRKPDPAVDPETDVDAFDAARIAPDQLVVVVGTFVPFLRELSGGATHIWSWNRTRQSLKPTSCHSIAMPLKRWLSCCRRMSYG